MTPRARKYRRDQRREIQGLYMIIYPLLLTVFVLSLGKAAIGIMYLVRTL
jgi:hypothetical protein